MYSLFPPGAQSSIIQEESKEDEPIYFRRVLPHVDGPTLKK